MPIIQFQNYNFKFEIELYFHYNENNTRYKLIRVTESSFNENSMGDEL